MTASVPCFFSLLPTQDVSSPVVPAGPASCSQESRGGKRIRHGMLGEFEFRVPHGVKYHRAVGFEGDVHDTLTARSAEGASELRIFTANPTWGPVKPGPDDWPADAARRALSVRSWQCSEAAGHDFRFTRNGREWRMLGFPFGYAEYQNVPPNIARKFDRVLDSLCCRPVPK